MGRILAIFISVSVLFTVAIPPTYSSSEAIVIPQFAVEPNNVRMVDGSSARSAVFTCLLAQPASNAISNANSNGAVISWFYNAKQIDSITDKIRIPLANGSLYVSAAAAEHPAPNSPLSDVPLPTAKGYNCKATAVLNYKTKNFNVTVVSRVAHVVKQQQISTTTPVRPQRLAVRIGSVVVLICGAGSATSSSNSSSTLVVGSDNSNSEQFVWFRDDSPFPDGNNNPSVTFIDGGRVVEFSAITSDDFGEYSCSRSTITTPEQRRNSILSRFVISQAVTIQNQLEEIESSLRFLIRPAEKMTISKTSPFTLLCSAAGFGANIGGAVVATSWLKDGETIAISSSSETDRFRKIGRGSLLVSGVHANDSGLYTCRAALTIGETTIFADANAFVSVVSAPKSSSRSGKTLIATTGGSVEINCDVENAVDFFWFHNGNYLAPPSNEEPISGASNREFFYEYGKLNENGRSLNLWTLLETDSGVYQCFGGNAAGLASSTTFLVVENNEFFSPAETVLRDTEDDRAKYPTNVRATSKSATTIHLSWEPPVLSNDAIISGYVVVLRSATLVKTEVLLDASNRLRRLFAANPELLIDHLAPGRKYEISVAIAFKASSQSTLTIGAPSQPILVSTEKSIPDGEGTTQNIDDYTDYASYSTFLQQPGNLKAEIRSPTTVSLMWTAPTTSPSEDGRMRQNALTRSLPNISRYRLFYRGGAQTLGARTGSQQDAYIDLPGHQTSHIFTSLQPNTPYTFFVRAGMSGNSGSENGEAAQLILGPASRDVTIWTPSAAPTGPPQKVESLATNPSTISVRWQPPLTNLQNGLITGYKVVYQPRSATQPAHLTGRTAITDGITTMISLKDGVAPSTDYEIRVAAINVNGTGPFSESVFAKTPEQQLSESVTPGAPFAFTARAPSPSQIVLSWQPPNSASSVIVRGYYVSYGVGEPYRNQVMIDSAKTEHILTNLRPSSEYIISLRSYNNYGYGPEVFQAVRTPQLPSSAPQSNSNEAVEDGNGFDKLLPNQQPASQPPTLLAVPLGVKAFTLSDSAILVSWTDPNEHSYRSSNHHQRGSNKEYHVTYTVRYGPLIPQNSVQDKNLPSVATAMKWRLVNSTLPSVRIHSLEPFQEYEFAVRIIRADADYQSRQQVSDWSMSAANRTLDAAPGDAPRDVKVAEVPPTSSSSSKGPAVRVSWQPPLKTNGIITSYVIFYSAHSPNRAERDWQVIGVGGDRFSVLIRRLQPDTSYYFKVQAKNARGYGPTSAPPVHIRTPLSHKPVVVANDEEVPMNEMSESRTSSNRLAPNQQSDSAQVDAATDNSNAADDIWPFDPSYFENQVVPRLSTTTVPLLFVTTQRMVVTRTGDGENQEQNLDIANASANTLWLAVSAAVGALIVCTVASIAVFVCRKISSPRSGSKLMPKSESMGPGRLNGNQNGKMPPPDGSLPINGNADMWAMREHLELRQQLLSSADMQSTVGVNGGGMSVLGMSEDNLLPNERSGANSARHRPTQPQDQQGTASMRQHLYHLDPYENETIIIGENGDHGRQTASSMGCSPSASALPYRHQQAANATARLFNPRTSAVTLSSCQEPAGYSLLSNNRHTYRHPSSTAASTNNETDEFIVDVNATAAAMSTTRLGSMLPYHVPHRGSPASIVGGMLNINDHPHLLHQHRQQSAHILVNHQTLPRLSIATMPSPAPTSVHRYEPLLTTTNNGFACQPSAQTPDSGCDIEHNLHHQIQQQRQRTSLSSSSYGGGSVSSSNNVASFGCSGSSCGSRQQQMVVSNNPNGDTNNSPSATSSGLSGSASSNERPRLSSFQPLQNANNGTPTVCSGNKTSFLHLSRVLPPTPGQTRSSTASSSATMSSGCNSQQQDRTSSATLSSSSPINNNNQPSAIPDIHLPPAPPELHSNDDDLAAAEMSCLDGLIKDLKLNVATSSSATIIANNNAKKMGMA